MFSYCSAVGRVCYVVKRIYELALLFCDFVFDRRFFMFCALRAAKEALFPTVRESCIVVDWGGTNGRFRPHWFCCWCCCSCGCCERGIEVEAGCVCEIAAATVEPPVVFLDQIWFLLLPLRFFGKLVFWVVLSCFCLSWYSLIILFCCCCTRSSLSVADFSLLRKSEVFISVSSRINPARTGRSAGHWRLMS